MTSTEGADTSVPGESGHNVSQSDSSAPRVVSSKPNPPPETKESVWLRRSVILSFWLVAVLLGVPVWWRTTAIYRAELPLQTMTDWADGKVCKPVFPLRIAVDVPIPPAEGQHLIRTTQHALDDLNEFSAHHLRLMLADPPSAANTSQQVVNDGTTVDARHDEDVALLIRLIQVETGNTPRSILQTYSPTLDIYYAANQLPSPSSTGSTLATFMAQELHKLFDEEQALLAYLLSTKSGTHTAKVKSLSPETAAELERQSTIAFKYAPTYHLTFSLFTPSSVPSDWEIESALRQYISPFLETFASISNFTIDSQVQLYSAYSPSIQKPVYDENQKAWVLRKEDLSGFINAAEWPLSPSIGAGPTVNFVLYVPDQTESPLLVQGSGANSWLIPQWGGVMILNPPADVKFGPVLTKQDLTPAMHTFSDQLMSLLGLPRAPASLPLRLSTLVRARAASLLFSASSTLGALARLYNALPSIPIPDKVAKSVGMTTAHLQQACDNLRNGRFQIALEHARIAEGEAEKAFFERSMVGQVYFPDEHKVAVYLPLLGPIAVPLVMAGLKELQGIISSLKTRKRA